MREKKQDEKMINQFVFKKAMIAGIIGGMFWTIIWLIMYYFHMLEVKPFIIWEKLFAYKEMYRHWYMYFIGVGLNGLVSMVFAAIYYICFKKIRTWMMGVLYGGIIWVLTYLLAPMVVTNTNLLYSHSTETHIGFLCLLLLYGLFIGYTISFDFESLHFEYENN